MKTVKSDTISCTASEVLLHLTAHYHACYLNCPSSLNRACFSSSWRHVVLIFSLRSFSLHRKKIQLSFFRFMAEPTKSTWILQWLWLQSLPSTCEDPDTNTHTHYTWESAGIYYYYAILLQDCKNETKD